MNTDCQKVKDIIEQINQIIDLIERRNKIRQMLEDLFQLIAAIIPGFPIPVDPMGDDELDAWWANLVTAMAEVDCDAT